MTEEFELLEDRLVSGRGIIQLPLQDEYEVYRLYIDLVREPSINFLNFKFPIPRGEYAKMQVMWGDYIYAEEVLRYDKYVFEYDVFEIDITYTSWLNCVLGSITDILALIAAQLGITLVPGTPLIYRGIRKPYSEIRFFCRNESALQLRLYGLKVDYICPANSPGAITQPAVPPPLPLVPPESNIEVSAPYAPPDDDGNTVPYTGDPVETVLFPSGDPCQQVIINWEVSFRTTPGGVVQTAQSSITAWGEVTDFRYFPEPPIGFTTPRTLEVTSRGVVGQTSCLSSVQNTVISGGSGGSEILSLLILSVTPQ